MSTQTLIPVDDDDAIEKMLAAAQGKCYARIFYASEFEGIAKEANEKMREHGLDPATQVGATLEVWAGVPNHFPADATFAELRLEEDGWKVDFIDRIRTYSTRVVTQYFYPADGSKKIAFERRW